MLSQTAADQIASLIPRLEGWATVEKAVAMADLIVSSKPKVIVEIGVFGGRSLIPQALALRELGSGHIYGIDPWRLAPVLEGNLNEADAKWWSRNVDLHEIHKGFMEALWREALDPWVTILRCTAEQALPLLPEIDILHIDGNHSELASCRDVEQFLPKVPAGGLIWFDDIDWETTRQAVLLLSTACERVQDVGTCALFRKQGNVEQQVKRTVKRAKTTARAVVESQFA